MKLTVAEIQEILDLPPQPFAGERIITQLLTDSRHLFLPAQTLFIALESSRRDGHQFIPDLYKKGVRTFLVKKSFDPPSLSSAVFLKVEDPLRSLQKIAAFWRNKFSLPCIGITGSNGKTIVKEWLFQLLRPDYQIVRSPKSYNSQIGVALSVTKIEKHHTLGIFEAGISQTGEMPHLQKMINPKMGIFTNIGEAHAGGFSSRREKIREKLALFEQAELLIYHKDNELLHEEILRFQKDKNKKLKLFSWSTESKDGAALSVSSIERKKPNSTQIQIIYQGKAIGFSIPFSDSGSIENAVHCFYALLALGVQEEQIRERMAALEPVAMRLEMKNGIYANVIINDSYNSDMESIRVALDFLTHQKQHSVHTLILSDIEQSGENEAGLYEQIASLVQARKIDLFVGIGLKLTSYKNKFDSLPKTLFFSSTEDFLTHLKERLNQPARFPFHNQVLLLKGARSFAFERISKLLEQKKHQTTLYIDLNAVAHNLNTYQSLLRPGVKTMVMVKAFSYGSGSAEIANLLQFHGVDYLAVANIEEGIFLRKNGITLPILVLNPDLFYFDELVKWELEPEIYSLRILKKFSDLLSRQGIGDYPVHLKIDTGMHRLGFGEQEIPQVIAFLKAHPELNVQSLFSHLAASDDLEKDVFTKKQGRLFDKLSKAIAEKLPYPVLRHLANTSGISRHPDLQFDMVRLGIGLYGIDPILQDQLLPVSTLKSTILQIREVKAGETVGYGRAGKVERDKKIAVVALGYADGYLRSLGLGKGKMNVHGKIAPTIGQICMDLLFLDVTKIAEAREGDSVTVFGQNPKIEELAKTGKTIPYEILAGLSDRIGRVYLQE